MKIIKSCVFFVLVIICLYSVVSCIIAIPLMEENNSQIQSIKSQLKEEMNGIQSTFFKHLDEYRYDSLTLARYDETARTVGLGVASTRLSNYLKFRVDSYKRSIENAGAQFIYKYNTENHDHNYRSINTKKDIILQQFKRNCDSAENEVLNSFLGVTRNVNMLYAISLVDTTKGYTATKSEFSKINNSLFFSPIRTDYGNSLEAIGEKNNSSIFFKLCNSLLKENSSSLVVILGMIGMSFFGAVISYLRKTPDNTAKIEFITDKLGSIALISVSSSIITYLSLQGGLSLVTTGGGANLNPYLILCVCFAASVYSEEIWLKAKNLFN